MTKQHPLIGRTVRLISTDDSGCGELSGKIQVGEVYEIAAIHAYKPDTIQVKTPGGRVHNCSWGTIGINYELLPSSVGLDDPNDSVPYDEPWEDQFKKALEEPEEKRIEDIWEAIKQMSKGGH